MTKANTAANGAAKGIIPANENSKAGATTTGQTSSPELSSLSVEKGTGELTTDPTKKPQPSIVDRLKKLEELQELVEKRDVIVQHLDNLNRFYIAPSGGCSLKLTDSKGNSFSIGNPIIIGEIVHMSKAKLQDELTRIEEAFVFEI